MFEENTGLPRNHAIKFLETEVREVFPIAHILEEALVGSVEKRSVRSRKIMFEVRKGWG